MDRLKDLKLKFKDFSEEVKVWFESKDCDQFVQKIGTTFNIDSNSLWDLILMLIENDFHQPGI
jgi:CBS-domain-containing membrane protein